MMIKKEDKQDVKGKKDKKGKGGIYNHTETGELPCVSFVLTRHIGEGVLQTIDIGSKSYDYTDAVKGLIFLLGEYDKRVKAQARQEDKRRRNDKLI